MKRLFHLQFAEHESAASEGVCFSSVLLKVHPGQKEKILLQNISFSSENIKTSQKHKNNRQETGCDTKHSTTENQGSAKKKKYPEGIKTVIIVPFLIL